MSGNKKAAPRRSSTGGGEGNGSLTASENPVIDFTTLPGWKQARIALMLGYGKAAAITMKELAAFLNDNEREISKAVERERGAGIPICASTDRDNSGLYLPADAAELAEYRRSLQRRVAAVSKTLHAIEDAHDGITGQQHIDMEADHEQPEQETI